MLSREAFEKKQIVCLNVTLGHKLSIKNDNMIVRDHQNKILLQVTLYRLFAVYIIGNTTLTSNLIQASKKFKFSICFFSSTMKLYEVIGAKMEGNFLLREKQYAYQSHEIGKHIIENKISNQIKTLSKIRYRQASENQSIKSMHQLLNNLKNKESITIAEMMGYEGAVAKLYFQELFKDYDWKRRLPRVKPDYINCSLDIGYTLLFNYIEAILSIYGFDLYRGVLHQQFYMRKSLVCDIIEPLRFIIDWQTRKSLNLKQISEDHFILRNHQYVLDWTRNRDYTQLYLKEILRYKDDIFHYIQSYYRCFMKEKALTSFPTMEA